MGVPYVPILGLVGTDLLKRRDDMVVAVDPFDGKTRTVVAKALRPDIAVFHVQQADRQGNVSCGYHAEAVLLAEASRHVIVTAEEIVDRLTEEDAVATFIPSIHVDAVVHAPFGAHPGGCTGRYGPDKAHMAQLRRCIAGRCRLWRIPADVRARREHPRGLRGAFRSAGMAADGPTRAD